MGQSELSLSLASEAELTACAGRLARRWRDGGHAPLLIGLGGELGSGKTTWVRAMLRGLGYTGRVPSPTYTLLEHYALEGLDVLHLDLYRLQAEEELENLGVRDWLGQPNAWILFEWPERAPLLVQRADLVIELELAGDEARVARLSARTPAGNRALSAASESDSNYSA